MAADASKGASTLSIAGGHVLDALTFCIGEFRSVSGSVATRVRSVPIEETGETVAVTAPDTVLIAGEVEGGAAVSAAITSVPAHGSGLRIEVHGSEGVLVIASEGMSQIAALTLSGARNDEGALAELPIPADCWWVPQDLVGPGLNVAQLFRRLGEAIRGGLPPNPTSTTPCAGTSCSRRFSAPRTRVSGSCWLRHRPRGGRRYQKTWPPTKPVQNVT